MSWRDKLLVTRAEAAEILSISVWSIDRLIKSGALREKKIGRRIQITTASLLAHLEGSSPEPIADVVPLSPAAERGLAEALRKARQ